MPRVPSYRIPAVLLLGLTVSTSSISAQTSSAEFRDFLHFEPTPLRAWLSVTRPVIDTPSTAPAAPVLDAHLQDAVFYSDGYYLRLNIHRYASYLTLPLFVSQYLVGQKLYNGKASESTRGLHESLASGTMLLYGVNAVTGIWNAWESRKNAAGRGGRIFHGALMTLSGIGFLAAQNSGPESEEGRQASRDSMRKHRNIAVTSMAVATVGYVYMLLKR